MYDGNAQKIQNLLKRFIDYEYEVRKLSPVSVHKHCIAIKQFYKSNEVVLNWDIINDYVGSYNNMKRSLDMPYTYEEIHKMLDKCDERKRVVILLLASTGMRRGALPELKYGDLTEIQKYGIYEITVYKGFPEEYKTYCSSECAQAIKSYLEYRERYGERITDESYIIRKKFNSNPNKYNNAISEVSSATDPPEKHRISNKEIEKMLYQLVYDSGIRNPHDKVKRLGDRHRNMLAHSFRKFFENKCLEAGIDMFFVSVLMGHRTKGIGVERHYFRPGSINGQYSLLELYEKKAMPLLTISEENRLKLKNRELELRMKEDEERFKLALEERDNKYSKELSKYDTLQKQIEELTKRVGG